jgi:hypothetical protein
MVCPAPTSSCCFGIQAGKIVSLTFLFFLSKTEERRAREWPLDTAELPEGHLEEWLEKRAKRLSSAPSGRYSPRVPCHPHWEQYPSLSFAEAEAFL